MKHGKFIHLPACPYCGTARPTLTAIAASEFSTQFTTSTHDNKNHRYWCNYACSTCGGVILASAPCTTLLTGGITSDDINIVLPEPRQVQPEIPERPRHFLDEAIRALATPSAAQMVCASAVDAMLKERGYTDGSLYSRIDKAATEHVITKDMASWAHHVRLEANGQRHADEDASLPTTEDAERCLEFALALAEFLFILPARVTRGLAAAAQKVE